MAVATSPVATLSEIELDSRRLAVENAIGSLRIENMILEDEPRHSLERYAHGEITLDELKREVSAYTATIV
jgi:hypothetical protein